MPIYEYRCESCDEVFEKIIYREADVPECPSCSSHDLEQLLSSFAVAGEGQRKAESEPGPCHCGAPRRGMCSM